MTDEDERRLAIIQSRPAIPDRDGDTYWSDTAAASDDRVWLIAKVLQLARQLAECSRELAECKIELLREIEDYKTELRFARQRR